MKRSRGVRGEPRKRYRPFSGEVTEVELKVRPGPGYRCPIAPGTDESDYEHARVRVRFDGSDGYKYWFWSPVRNVYDGWCRGSDWISEGPPEPLVQVGDRIDIEAKYYRETQTGMQLNFVRRKDGKPVKKTVSGKKLRAAKMELLEVRLGKLEARVKELEDALRESRRLQTQDDNLLAPFM